MENIVKEQVVVTVMGRVIGGVAGIVTAVTGFDMANRRRLAEAKQWFMRGMSYMTVFTSTGIIILNLKMFEGFITGFGIPIVPLYVLAAPVYLTMCYCIGMFDEKRGIWSEENRFISLRANPITVKIVTHLETIEREQKEVQERLDRIEQRLDR